MCAISLFEVLCAMREPIHCSNSLPISLSLYLCLCFCPCLGLGRCHSLSLCLSYDLSFLSAWLGIYERYTNTTAEIQIKYVYIFIFSFVAVAVATAFFAFVQEKNVQINHTRKSNSTTKRTKWTFRSYVSARSSTFCYVFFSILRACSSSFLRLLRSSRLCNFLK